MPTADELADIFEEGYEAGFADGSKEMAVLRKALSDTREVRDLFESIAMELAEAISATEQYGGGTTCDEDGCPLSCPWRGVAAALAKARAEGLL